MSDKMEQEVGCRKLKVDTPGNGPSFWFRDTFTATKKRSTDRDITWYRKDEVAFNSLKNFGLVRGDYRYVELVDGKSGGIGNYENTSASFARQRLEIPDKYKFLDLNGVLSVSCLRYFAEDYKRVVTNLLDAMGKGKPLDTESIKYLLFKKGRNLLSFPDAPTLKRKRPGTAPRNSPSRGDNPAGEEEEEDEPAQKKTKQGTAPPTSPDKDNPPFAAREEAVGKKGEQLDPYGPDFWRDFDLDVDQDILTSLTGSFCISTHAGTGVEKASRAVEAMGMNSSFPIYKELTKRLGKYENTTTAYATRDLRLNEQTGIKKVPDLNCALTIFALTEMASDLHRLVVGIRQLIKREEDAGKEQLSQLLYHYDIGGEEEKGLVGTHTGELPICDEPEVREYMMYWDSRREWRAQSRAELN